MNAFLGRLLDLWIEAETAPETLDSLWLARGALARANQSSRTIRHLAVLGPTQSGKSSLVNLLLGAEHASVSPLAGHTRHAQAFGVECDPRLEIENWFPDVPIVAPEVLDSGQTRLIAARTVSAGAARVDPQVCVWDTPDFDSVTADAYRSAVLAAAGTADTHLLVVSREKYADQSVWRLLKLLAPLGRPTLIVLNKTDPDSEARLRTALEARLSDWPHARPTLAMLPYVSGGLEQASAAATQMLAARVRELLKIDAADGVSDLLGRHWSTWTAPARTEHAALEAWRSAAEAGLQRMMDDYRRDYIDHPERFNEFRRAVLQLLELLEIPVLAKVMGHARHWMTWPARQVGKLRQSSKPADERGGDEAIVLRGAVDALIVRLKLFLVEHDAAATWAQVMSARLGERDTALLERFEQAAREHRQAFATEIQAAAGSMRKRLAEQPVLLNTLRTARATADAAAIGVALKTGGLAPTGALLAPVLMSLTEHLTRGALGAYMTQVSNNLKSKQFEAVRHNVVNSVLRPALLELTDDLHGKGVWGISPEELAELDRWMNAGSDIE